MMYGKIKKLHFVGIGGIGMSGIAEVLLNLGYQVSGSDLSVNANVRRLTELGAIIHQGHQSAQVEGADAVIYSSAVTKENPELRAAQRQHIPLVSRAEMLAELMRLKYGIAVAGTHGKTTTTSLIATILAEAGLDPTVVNGGVLNALGSNARLGQGKFLVAEADESDGSFLKLQPIIAVVTNMDPEHLEHYGTFEVVREAYRSFIAKIPFYGLVVLCQEHPETAALLPYLVDKRVVTYGCDAGDYRAADVVQVDTNITRFAVVYHNRWQMHSETLGEIDLPIFGKHNIANALAAIAVARELDIPWEVIRQALLGFRGVQRRFDRLWQSPERVVIDDYAHHPVEIRATLAAAREVYGADRRLVAIFQPHRYSRVHALLMDFFLCFQEASLVLVLPIYAAGEAPLPGILQDGGQTALIAGIPHHSGVTAHPMPTGEQWLEELDRQLMDGDVLVFLGAGDITRKARAYAQWRQAMTSTPAVP